MNGYVRTLRKDREYGFIRAEGTDYFFHKSEMDNPADFNQLREKDPVIFEPDETSRGLRARMVELA